MQTPVSLWWMWVGLGAPISQPPPPPQPHHSERCRAQDGSWAASRTHWFFQPFAWMHHMAQAISMAPAILTAQSKWIILLAAIKEFSWSFPLLPFFLRTGGKGGKKSRNPASKLLSGSSQRGKKQGVSSTLKQADREIQFLIPNRQINVD